VTQLPLFEGLGADPVSQSPAESARLLARLDKVGAGAESAAGPVGAGQGGSGTGGGAQRRGRDRQIPPGAGAA